MKTPTKILCLLFIAAMAALYCFNTVWSCHLEAMAAKLPILTLEEQNNQHLFWLGARSMWFAIYEDRSVLDITRTDNGMPAAIASYARVFGNDLKFVLATNSPPEPFDATKLKVGDRVALRDNHSDIFVGGTVSQIVLDNQHGYFLKVGEQWVQSYECYPPELETPRQAAVGYDGRSFHWEAPKFSVTNIPDYFLIPPTNLDMFIATNRLWFRNVSTANGTTMPSSRNVMLGGRYSIIRKP